ncbi:hypothetical protein BDV93DRAFT_19718 [Ceratobasidium sp. AG-I]|nr:hypothetical protein BDV93DRAFT_19718 [Ceratobasidium sp. AG-I]
MLSFSLSVFVCCSDNRVACADQINHGSPGRAHAREGFLCSAGLDQNRSDVARSTPVCVHKCTRYRGVTITAAQLVRTSMLYYGHGGTV